ncbi:MAG: peptidylprolyl isomerase [Planctomycetes bacterium]|nr:peptidylprolyl isomerase [Planctomycetota bacterium]
MTTLFRGLALSLVLLSAAALPAQDTAPPGAPDPAKVPTAPANAPDRIGAAHIVIAFVPVPAPGEKPVPPLPGVTRTRDEAKELAQKVLALARARGADFAALALQYSDDPGSRERGGVFGNLERGRLKYQHLEQALFGMEEGQVSDVLETPVGFHIVTRIPVQEDVTASHILIMWKGSERAPESVTRTKEEALKLLQDVQAKLQAGLAFAELARQFSDCPSSKQGGALPPFARGQMTPNFEKAAFALKPGQTSDIVETPFGYHLILRRAPPVQIRASHILLMYKGSMRAPETVTRTKEEARAAAESILKRLQAGEDIAAIAHEISDCPSKKQGGDLGTFGEGTMHPDFERAAFALAVGGVSGIVETPFGFHVIKRTQ